MALRPSKKLEQATKMQFEVAAAKTVTAGKRVKHSGADYKIENATATDLGIGTAETSGTAGEKVLVVLDGPVVPVLVGTGGATRGLLAKPVSDGYTDVTPSGAGTTIVHAGGIFLESGVALDMVGMIQSPRSITEA